MSEELGKRDIDFIRRRTERRGIIILDMPRPGLSSLPYDDDRNNLAYVQDDLDAVHEAGLGSGMHICYERHLSRNR
jgi:hypothetical protein